jgi:hypothetical protein
LAFSASRSSRVLPLAYPVGLMNTGGDYVNRLTGQPFVQGPNRCMK